MILHDPVVRQSLGARLRALTADAQRRWGEMSVDQMLRHVNVGFEHALGRLPAERSSAPRLPKAVIKFLALNLPWPKGKVPTSPTLRAVGRYEFDRERERTLALIDEACAKSLDSRWVDNHTMGPMTGHDWSRLMAKHVDHHLKQFGV